MQVVTDRTEADVIAWKNIIEKIKNGTASSTERSTFTNQNHKGAYTYVDLNRVGTALIEAQSLASELGEHVVYPITPRTNWTTSDDFNLTAQTNYLDCVREIYRIVRDYIPGIVIPDSMDGLTYIGANNIELAVNAINEMIQGIVSEYRYAGDAYAGG